MGTLFLISFAIIGIVFLIMAVGVMFGRNPIRGSCGGHDNGECVCSQAKQEACENRKQRLAAEQGNATKS